MGFHLFLDVYKRQEYGRNVLINHIIDLYQELEGEFDKESIELCRDRLSFKNDSELLFEYGKSYEPVSYTHLISSQFKNIGGKMKVKTLLNKLRLKEHQTIRVLDDNEMCIRDRCRDCNSKGIVIEKWENTK